MRALFSAQAYREPKYWASLTEGGSLMHPLVPQFTLHSDSSDLGWGGTVAQRDYAGSGCPGTHPYRTSGLHWSSHIKLCGGSF